jgi:hypothetical protein
MTESTYPQFPVMMVDDEAQAITSFEMTLRSANMNNFIRCHAVMTAGMSCRCFPARRLK